MEEGTVPKAESVEKDAAEDLKKKEELKRKDAARKRLRRARMTPEEREKVKAKTREYRNRRKQDPELAEKLKAQQREYRMRQKENPELAEKVREQKRQSQNLKLSSLTPEKQKRRTERARLRRARIRAEGGAELERMRAHNREIMRRRRARMTEEEKEAERFQNFVRKAEMTEEEREERRARKYFEEQARLAKRGKDYKDSEEYKAYRKRKAEYARKWRQQLSPEARKRVNERIQRSSRKHWAKAAGEDPETTEKTESQLRRIYLERLKVEDPEKWERWMSRVRASGRKTWLRIKNSNEHSDYREKLREYHVMKYANMSPEKKERRKFGMKVYAAKRKLEKQMEEEGQLNSGEIEQRLRKLHEEMWLTFDPNWTWEQYNAGKSKRRKGDETVNTCVAQEEDARSQLASGDCQSLEENELENCEESMTPQHDSSLDCISIPSIEQHQREFPTASSHLAFFCMRCFPKQVTDSRFMPVGFLTKLELLDHVLQNHATHYFPCEDCYLLKYSTEALQLHKKICLRR